MSDGRVTPLADTTEGVSIAYSSVAIGVRLTADALHSRTRRRSGGKAASSTDQKDELGVLLREIGQFFADRNMLRPVVGVLEASGEALKEATRWAKDQDWHRGEFVLYAEPPGTAEERMRDVLDPSPPTVSAHAVTRAEIMTRLGAPTGYPDRPDETIGNLVEHWFEPGRHHQRPSRDEWKKSILEGMAAWFEGRAAHDQQPPSPGAAESAPPLPPTRIDRVTNIAIEAVRGWPHRFALETNAEIVLVSAPNGHGKSSLFEALARALTLYPPKGDGDWRHILHRGENDEGRVSLVTQERERSRGLPEVPRRTRRSVSFDRGGGLTPAFTADSDKGELDPWVGRAEDHWPGTRLSPELQWRMTAWLPEHVRHLYDDGAKEPTLLDALRPIPIEFEALRELIEPLVSPVDELPAARDAARRIEDGLATISDEAVERALAGVEAACSTIEAHLHVARVPLQADRDASAAMVGTDGHLHVARVPLQADGAFTALLAAVDDARDALLIAVNDARDAVSAGRETGSGVVAAAKHLVQALRELRDTARRWSAERGPGRASSDLETLLAERERLTAVIDPAAPAHRLLFGGEPPTSWLQAQERSRLRTVLLGTLRLRQEHLPAAPPDDRDEQRIYDEIRLVRPDQVEAALRAEERVAARVAEHHSALVELEKRIASAAVEDEDHSLRDAIQQLIGQHALPAGLKALEEAVRGLHVASPHNRIIRQRELGAHRKWLEDELPRVFATLLDGLRAPGVREGTEEAIFRSIQQVARRFALSTGPTSLRISAIDDTTREGTAQEVRETRRLKLELGEGDGRWLGVDQFSTGTRAQLAIAHLVGQKLAALSAGVPAELGCPNRILVLDDLSTAYDLTNLTREALLWRQLAFHPDPEQRLQIFLASHHDTLTNRLLDDLAPPPGCRVILHRIDDWTLEGGPVVSSFDLVARDEGVFDPTFHHDLKELLR